MRPHLLFSALLLASAVAVSGCTVTPSPGSGTAASGPAPANGPVALASVGGLAVKGRAPKTGYARELFGKGWLDTDGSGCGTREDILKRDLAGATFKDGCKVLAGVLEKDPYTGNRIAHERGRTGVDIDHIVALSDAWQKGAGSWDKGKRIAFANDLMLAV